VFGAKVLVNVVRHYGLDQEYITPYSPEQNGMIERFRGARVEPDARRVLLAGREEIDGRR